MIRQLHPDDWQTFRELRLEALTLEPAAYASTLAEWDHLTEPDWRARLREIAVFALFDDGPAGLAGLRPDGGVVMVYVRPAARGRGHAAALMEHVRQSARGRSCIWLHVSPGNDGALRLYQRLGYVAIGMAGADTVMARVP